MDPNIRVMIACCGRSGSRFTVALLSRYGIEAGHESSTSGGVVGFNWNLYSHEPFNIFLHQIREPIACIRSITTLRKQMFKMIERNAGIVDRPHGTTDDEWHMIRAMNYYVRWNNKARESATWSYRVEDLKKGSIVFHEWLEKIGLPKERQNSVHGLSTHTNTRKHLPKKYTYPECSWSILRELHPGLCLELANISFTHGYEVPEKFLSDRSVLYV